MEKFGKTYATVGGGQPGVIPVLQGSDTGGPYIWVVFLVAVVRNN